MKRVKNPVILGIRKELKEMANEIHKFKASRSKYNSGFVPGLSSMRSIYRCKHIAYCELRGIERNRIEIPADNNQPDEYLISKYKADWKTLLEKWESERKKEEIADAQ